MRESSSPGSTGAAESPLEQRPRFVELVGEHQRAPEHRARAPVRIWDQVVALEPSRLAQQLHGAGLARNCARSP